MNRLPAGLLDSDIEFFNDPQDQEKAYCLTEGSVMRITDAHVFIIDLIDADMAKHPEKVEALVELGYETQQEQREKYCSCCFGAFDGSPDVVDGEFIHNEYWPCPLRGSCPVEGKLCDGLKVGEGKALTRREIDVLALAGGECMLDKEIADKLCISEQTVKIHLKHIREKTGLQNKKDLVKLAHQKNLI
jgi:DNA-binding CsgD family transcriptional regulator